MCCPMISVSKNMAGRIITKQILDADRSLLEAGPPSESGLSFHGTCICSLTTIHLYKISVKRFSVEQIMYLNVLYYFIITFSGLKYVLFFHILIIICTILRAVWFLAAATVSPLLR